jgi:ABC-2 type transport system permease protein
MLSWRAFRSALEMHLRLYTLQQGRIITSLAMPAVMAAIAVLVLRQGQPGPERYFHVMVGGGLAGMWGGVLGTAMMTLRREREWYGTLPLLTVVAAPLESVYGGYLVAEACLGFAGIGASLGIGALLLDGAVQIAAPATLLVSLPVAAVAVAAVAFPIMSLVLLAPMLTRWINGMEAPVWILAGFLFPVALLPAWTSPASRALPVYWATEALRQAAMGSAGWVQAAPLWLAAIGLSVVYVVLGLGLLRSVVRHLHRSGALVTE